MASADRLQDLQGWDDTDPAAVSPGRDRLRALTAQLAELADRIVVGELDDAAVDGLARAVQVALATEPVAGDDPHIHRDRHPWMGLANVGAPPMRLRWDGTTLFGAVWCGPRFEGPPGTVHGGVIAGLFDAMVATRGSLSGAAITANLTIDYLAPTPLMADLQMTAVVERSEGRKTYLAATLSAGAVLCARASALLLVRPELAGPRSLR